ncbi:unnamed protein product [Scytosiphon promiscuus]
MLQKKQTLHMGSESKAGRNDITGVAGIVDAEVCAAEAPEHRHGPASGFKSEIDRAKLSIAPGARLGDWSTAGASSTSSSNVSAQVQISSCHGSVTVGTSAFKDNVDRSPGSAFADDEHGDTLPRLPTVLTGLLDRWAAYASPDSGKIWTLQNLAARTVGTMVSLDGGPSFARQSMSSGKVSLAEYQRYAENSSDGDSAPLYVFDPNILGPSSTFRDDGSPVRDAFDTPPCFSRDAASEICDDKLRPLPPKWLLVGAVRSGTPIHDHPTTVAWNALLVGCKLWCCFPPDVDESALLLNLDAGGDDEGGEEFDLSALEWFCRAGASTGDGEGGRQLHDSARIIVQRPGEVVFLPVGWFHVVLNVETSTALSMSLTLRRDLQAVLPLFREEEREFALWGQPHSGPALQKEERERG